MRGAATIPPGHSTDAAMTCIVSVFDMKRSRNAPEKEDAPAMKYAVYEHPVTHKFALVLLPTRFVEGDAVPLTNSEQWFDTRDAAIATVRNLLDRTE
jgi:hypothetical protein